MGLIGLMGLMGLMGVWDDGTTFSQQELTRYYATPLNPSLLNSKP